MLNKLGKKNVRVIIFESQAKKKNVVACVTSDQKQMLADKNIFSTQMSNFCFLQKTGQQERDSPGSNFCRFEINSRLVLFRVGGVSMAPETKMAEMFKIF